MSEQISRYDLNESPYVRGELKKLNEKKQGKNIFILVAIILYLFIIATSAYSIYYVASQSTSVSTALTLNILALIATLFILIGSVVLQLTTKNYVSIFKYIFCVLAIIGLSWNIYYIFNTRYGTNWTPGKTNTTYALNGVLLVAGIVILIISTSFIFWDPREKKEKQKIIKNNEKISRGEDVGFENVCDMYEKLYNDRLEFMNIIDRKLDRDYERRDRMKNKHSRELKLFENKVQKRVNMEDKKLIEMLDREDYLANSCSLKNSPQTEQGMRSVRETRRFVPSNRRNFNIENRQSNFFNVGTRYSGNTQPGYVYTSEGRVLRTENAPGSNNPVLVPLESSSQREFQVRRNPDTQRNPEQRRTYENINNMTDDEIRRRYCNVGVTSIPTSFAPLNLSPDTTGERDDDYFRERSQEPVTLLSG